MNKTDYLLLILFAILLGGFILYKIFLGISSPSSTISIDPDLYVVTLEQSDNYTTVNLTFHRGYKLKRGITYMVNIPNLEDSK